MNWRQRAGSALVGVLTVSLLAACGSGTSAGPAAGKTSGTPGAMSVGIRTDAASLTPAGCSRVWNVCAPIYGTLMRYNAEKKDFEPAIAQSLTTKDGKDWTLKLRPGTKFSDGTPFDAAAVAFNWKAQSDPAVGAAGITTLLQMTWKVVDPTTLTISFKSPNYLLPWAMQYSIGFIGSPTALQKNKDAGTNPVGAGPFVVTNYRQGSEIKLKANPDYVETGLPKLKTLDLKVIPADDQRVNALRTGDINVDPTYLASDAKTLEADGYSVIRTPLWGGTGLSMNFRDPTLKDPDLRHALLGALNADQITAAAYPGSKAPTRFYPEGSPYADSSSPTYPAFDLATAQSEFDAYLKKVGKSSLDLSLSVYADYPILTQGAQLVQAQLSQLKGLSVKIGKFETIKMYGKLMSGDFQLAINASQSQDPTIMAESFHTGGPVNFSGYSNPKVDAALDTIKGTDDQAQVSAAWKVVGDELTKDAPLRLYTQEQDILIATSDVTGLNPVSVGAFSFELADVTG